MNFTNLKSQAGTTLIEVLVTLLVLSIGALGIAALQLTGLKYNAGASARTQASLLSNDLMDRMRANRTIALSGGYNVASATTFSSIGDLTDPTEKCTESECSTAQLAQRDVFDWMSGVSSLLPSGQARVVSNAAGAQTIFSITFQLRQAVNQQGSTDPDDELQVFTFTGAL